MDLPIEHIHGTNPPRFRWRQILPGGSVVRQTGSLPPNLEGAVLDLIKIAEDRLEEMIKLRKQVEGMAEKPKPVPVPTPQQPSQPPPQTTNRGK